MPVPLTRNINPLPQILSHSTEERVRDKNVKLPHMVTMVMAMCVVFCMWQGLIESSKSFHINLADSGLISVGVLWWW